MQSVVRSMSCCSLAVLLWLATSAAWAQQQSTGAPNRVDITPRLVTSGQPSAEALGSPAAQGFEAVIYLAPPTVSDAVRDEAIIVGKQGLVFGHPTARGRN
jgi:hypothetical protein